MAAEASEPAAGGGEEAIAAGVSLSQYAAVHAALAEEFPLETVLRHEGLDPASWPAIDAAWSLRMRRSASGDQLLFDAYDAELAAARDRFARALPPIDEELQAWLDFLRAWSEADDPFEMLEERGLRPSDLTRLQALWAKRLAEDGALRDAALLILDEPAGPCPTVKASAAALPPPIVPRAAAAPPPAKKAEDKPRRPSLSVALPGAAAKIDLGGTMAAPEGFVLPALPFLPGAPGAPAAAAPRIEVKPPSAAAPKPDPLNMTGVVDPSAIRVALPFPISAEKPPEAPIAPPPPPPIVVAAPAPDPLNMTGVLDPSAMRAALPFLFSADKAKAAPAAPAPSAPAPSAPAPSAPAPSAPGSALTLEQYASLCAELAVAPRDSESIFKRYGLESQKARLDTDLGWRERLRRSPEQYRVWQDLYLRFQAYWKERRGR